jgi:hypothetical protein
VDGKAVVFMQMGVASTCMQRSEWQGCGNAPNVKKHPWKRHYVYTNAMQRLENGTIREK